MPSKLSIDQTHKLLDEVLASSPLEECHTCECFLGYLTRLELDAEQDLQALFSPYKPDKAFIHSCLGCDPCPPADAFASYLKAKNLIDPASL